jgi:phage FluMu protein gp41
MQQERQERELQLGRFRVRLRELTAEDEWDVAQRATVWNPRKKMFETDRKELNALLLVRSIVPESWPSQELGSLSSETIKKLPAKYARPLMLAYQRLNTLDEDSRDFLDTQSSQAQEGTSSPQS